MSADDQQFLDVLSGLQIQLRRYTNDVADFIDHNVDRAAEFARETLSTQQWLPDSIRPRPPVPPTVTIIAASRLEHIQDWVSRHKIATGILVATCGLVVYKGYRRTQRMRKTRRAKRARNGGRTEVVVIAGSPMMPLTKSLALDMERRGFIVYVVCNAVEDETLVHSYARSDIRPLTLDTTNPPSAGAAIERFALYLQVPQAPGPHLKPNQLTLKSILLIPNLNYQTSPIATIPPSTFAHLLNTHLLLPILTIQAFLPLLTSRLNSIGEKWIPPKVLIFTPSIISSINPPFHAPEATISSALSSFSDVLRAELRPLDIPVTHIQMGTFDFSAFLPAGAAAAAAAAGRASAAAHGSVSAGNPEDTLMWPDGARHVYGRNFVAQANSAISGARIRGFRGSSLRGLHATVFDIMDGSIRSPTIRVGLGAGVYGFVGRWVPRGLVSWMMGIRRVDQLSTWKTSSYEGSDREESDEEGEDAEAGSQSHEFVAVTPEKNVWNSEGDSHLWSSSMADRSRM